MAWYAYCIREQQILGNVPRVRRPFPIEGLHGVGGAQVMGYPTSEFAVVVSEYIRSGRLDQNSAIEHAQVVAECFRHSTVLPFRFGTVFDTDEGLKHAVRVNRKAFVDSVQHLRGKSEMHLKLVVRDGSMPEVSAEGQLPSVGAEYLSKLHEKAFRERERQTKARALSGQVHKLFNPLQEEITCKIVESGNLLIDIAHLVDNKSLEKYQHCFNEAARRLKDCRLVISGPWPPYHFLPGKLHTINES